MLTSLINNLNAATSGVVHATGEMRDYQLWGSIIRVSSVVFAFFLIKEFDIPELGLVAVLLCASIAHAVGLVIVKKLVGLSIRDYLKKVVFPVLIVLFVSTIIAYAVHLLMAEGFLRLIIVIFVSLVSVCLLCFYVAFEENERVLSIQLLKPVISFMKKNSE